MKRIDTLILGSFLKLFMLTVCAALFVLLMQFFLIHLNDVIGKGLGPAVYGQLACYVGIVSIKQALPMAILLSSIMTLGNLSEHHELTALRSAGISFPRILLPLLCFVIFVSASAYVSNSYLVPRAYLRACGLLYDVRKKKPRLFIKAGVFCNDIPGYSIKVRSIKRDRGTLEGIMIYDHTPNNGGISLTTANSGSMYTTENGSYLVIELIDGHHYSEVTWGADIAGRDPSKRATFHKRSFKQQTVHIRLEPFELSRTNQALFKGVCSAKDRSTLTSDIAAMRQWLQRRKLSNLTQMKRVEATLRKHELVRHKMASWAVSCIVVFLTGALLGTVLRKGRLGTPLILAAGMITSYYILDILSGQWTEKGIIDAWSGAWLSNGGLIALSLCFWGLTRRRTSC